MNVHIKLKNLIHSLSKSVFSIVQAQFLAVCMAPLSIHFFHHISTKPHSLLQEPLYTKDADMSVCKIYPGKSTSSGCFFKVKAFDFIISEQMKLAQFSIITFKCSNIHIIYNLKQDFSKMTHIVFVACRDNARSEMCELTKIFQILNSIYDSQLHQCIKTFNFLGH